MTERDIRRLCEQRGLRLERRGQGWLIRGAGVSILCADLAAIQPRDLEPVRRTLSRAERLADERDLGSMRTDDAKRAHQQCSRMTRDFQRTHSVNDD
jgi:hypothetical protein